MAHEDGALIVYKTALARGTWVNPGDDDFPAGGPDSNSRAPENGRNLTFHMIVSGGPSGGTFELQMQLANEDVGDPIDVPFNADGPAIEALIEAQIAGPSVTVEGPSLAQGVTVTVEDFNLWSVAHNPSNDTLTGGTSPRALVETVANAGREADEAPEGALWFDGDNEGVLYVQTSSAAPAPDWQQVWDAGGPSPTVIAARPPSSVEDKAEITFEVTGSPTGGNFDVVLESPEGHSVEMLAIARNVSGATLAWTIEKAIFDATGRAVDVQSAGGPLATLPCTVQIQEFGAWTVTSVTPHLTGGTAPTATAVVSDDGAAKDERRAGTVWVDTAGGDAYIQVDSDVGSNWKQMTP